MAKNAGVVSLQMLDRWSWWRKALEDPSLIGKGLPVHPDVAELGYYRRRAKNGPWEPVGIWLDEKHEMVAYRGDQKVSPEEIFSWCCRNPVSYESYMQAKDGKGWPDDDKVVAAQMQPPEPTIGDNSGTVDEAETLKSQIESSLKGVDAYAKITDDVKAAKAQSLRNRLNELSGDADKKREALTRPHLDANLIINKKWMPLVKSAKTGADTVKTAMEAWETEKLRVRREEQKTIDDARIAAEQAAREQQGETDTIDAPAPAPLVEAAPAPIRATYGKSASVKATIVVDEVTDWPALAVYMSNHQESQDLLRKLAQRALDAGRTNIPGITTTEAAKVR